MKRKIAAKLRGFVDSTDRSTLAVLFRIAGLTVSFPYSLFVRINGKLYDVGLLKSERVERPTIAVGNITMGGVGKSPFVAWLADCLLRQGVRPGLISRGYKAPKPRSFRQRDEIDANEVDKFASFKIFNDEALEFSLYFPNVPYFLGRDRVSVAKALLQNSPDIEVILLDDAFQNRKIRRDLNVVLLDALNPFGGGRVAPSGFLREPLSGLSRADAILLNRSNLVDEATRLEIREKAISLAPGAIWGEIVQRPRSVWKRLPSQSCPGSFDIEKTEFEAWVKLFKSKRIIAFCGLGAPAGFKKTLEKQGLHPISFIEFPDHHKYQESDVKRLANVARSSNADVILTTMKDFVKFTGTEQLNAPLFALSIGVDFLSGEEMFCKKVFQILKRNRLNLSNN